MSTVLVVGAQKGSLGAYIADALVDVGGLRWDVETAGLQEGEGEPEDHLLVLDKDTPMLDLVRLLEDVHPDHVVCTAGINKPRDINDSWWYQEHFSTNVIGPMRLLDAWLATRNSLAHPYTGHYVAISSNSAHIARTYSGAYCASKAALSMALRCKAREEAGQGGAVIYGYEPGLLKGTPMTADIKERLGDKALSRIPGQAEGLDPALLGLHIANNIVSGGRELNGCMLRIDGGDQ